jgi:LEA14-like dessication related protein
MKACARAVSLLPLIAVVAACSELVRAPVVELTGVRVRSIGLRGATLLAQLEIENPNRFAIETDSITFQFEASDVRERGTWKRVTSGTNVEQHRVEKESRATVEIPIDFAYSDLGTPIRSLIERGAFDYRVSGVVFVKKPLRKRVPFSREGNLSLSGNQ